MPYMTDTLNAFDPNRKDSTHPWATYVPSRGGGSAAFKVHRSRGPALAAINFARYGTLYEWRGNQWVEVARLNPEQRPTDCEVCGKPEDKQQWRTSLKAVWTQKKNPTPKLQWACDDCEIAANRGYV